MSFQLVNPGRHLVEAVKQRIDHGRIQRELVRADSAEQILAGMDHPGEARQVEQAGRALQGMDRAEHLVDQALGGRRALELQQALGGAFEIFPCLRDEAFEQGRHRIDVPVSSRAISSRSLGRTGLVR